MILISDSTFIENTPAIVDQDEFTELRKNIDRIREKALCFLVDYVSCIHGMPVISPEEFQRRYQFSTLPYFHELLPKTLFL